MRTKWEYMYITAYKNDVQESWLGVTQTVGEGRNTLPGFLHDAGNNGWEVAGIASGTDTGQRRLILKREVTS